MTDRFSLGRAWMLTVKTFRENWRDFVMMTAVMTGVMLLLTLWSGYNYYTDIRDGHTVYNPNDIESVWFLFLLFFFGSLAGSKVFDNMKSKESRLSSLMLPATQDEKYFVRWMIFVPGFFLLYLLIFYVADAVRVAVWSGMMPDNPDYNVTFHNVIGTYFADGDGIALIKVFGGAYIASCSFFTLGSILWPKKPYIKTLIAGGILSVIYSTCFSIGINLGTVVEQAGGYFFYPKNGDNGDFVSSIILCIFIIVAVINYTLARFRFRESEIVNRW